MACSRVLGLFSVVSTMEGFVGGLSPLRQHLLQTTHCEDEKLPASVANHVWLRTRLLDDYEPEAKIPRGSVRERNKIAARRYRQRQRAYVDRLEKRILALQAVIAEQAVRIQQLEGDCMFRCAET